MASKVGRTCVLSLKIRKWVFQERGRVQFQMLLKDPVKIEKSSVTILTKCSNSDISKNYLGEILVTESNLEWVESWLRSKEIILSCMAMKVKETADMEIDQM